MGTKIIQVCDMCGAELDRDERLRYERLPEYTLRLSCTGNNAIHHSFGEVCEACAAKLCDKVVQLIDTAGDE